MKPLVCFYYVTLRCNAKCVFCNIWQNKEHFHLKEQTLEAIESNLKDLKRIGVRLIDFTGGEPLLFPHLADSLKAAKRRGFYTTITTNCLLYPKHAESLKGIVNLLAFSLDSADAGENDRLRGVKTHQKVVESIALAKELREKVYLIHTVTNENHQDIGAAVELARKNKVTLFLNPCFEYFGNEPISAEAARAAAKYFKSPYVVVDLAHLELIRKGGNKTQRPICKAVSSTLVISPDNQLMLPCFHNHVRKIKIENNLFVLHDSDEVREMKKQEGRFKFCEGCTIYCYMKTSLYRNVLSKYFYLSAMSGYKYVRERARRQF